MLSLSLLIPSCIVETAERAVLSFLRSWNYYVIRQREHLQPSTGYFLDLFNPEHQLFISISIITFYVTVTYLLLKKSVHYPVPAAILLLFNIINASISLFLFASLLKYKAIDDSMLLCNPLFLEERANQRGFNDRYIVTNLFLLFYFMKIIESMQSWILIVRGYSSAVSIYHVASRISLIAIVCLVFPFDHNGDMYVPVLMNSLVHGLIYCHYFFSMLGVRCFFSPFLPQLQIFQFIVVFIHAFLTYRVGPTCGAPDFAKILVMMLTGSLILLVAQIYISESIFSKRKRRKHRFLGVVKTPVISLFSRSLFLCGEAVLDEDGQAKISFPLEFESSGLEASCSLTAVGGPMPALHVQTPFLRNLQGDGGSFIISGGDARGRVSWILQVHSSFCSSE